jgi:serine/threonine-protein kinase HipA
VRKTDFTPVMHVSAFYEPVEGQRQLVGHLRRERRELLFEFDPGFLATGLQLSPFKLPLRAGVTRGDLSRFDGLMGLFDDSLPDGWGRLLIERRAQRLGLSRAHFGPLDRLSLVGRRGMGALVYEPDAGLPGATLVDLELVEREIAAARADRKRADLDQLFALGGAPHGARPKALVLLDGKGRVRPDGGARGGCTAWMVKFRSKGDAPSRSRH